MNRFNITLFFALALGVFLPQLPTIAQDESGWYTGGAIGLSDYTISGFDDDRNIPDKYVDFDEAGFSYRALVGRRFNQNFALELSLSDYGEVTGPPSEGGPYRDDKFLIHERAATAYVSGILPLGNHYLPEFKHVELVGRTGPAWVQQEVVLDGTDPSGNPFRTTRDQNGIGVAANIGLNFYVTEQLAIRGEMESIFGNPTDLDDFMHTERIFGFVGIQYNFHALPASDGGR